MHFSVLISIYIKESPEFLVEAFDSVFNQTAIPSEVVLVKDGPLTETLDKIIREYEQKYSTLKVISLPQNRGLGFALNEGLRHCSNELVARMDTDDRCFLDRFEKQLALYEKYPELSFVGTSIAEFEKTIDEVSGYRTPPQKHEDIIKFAKKKSPMNHATVMYKKQAVIDAGGYGEFPEDYHLWIRAMMKGFLFYNIQEPLLYVRFNMEAIKRRGGLKYAITEVKHQKEFYKLGFLSYTEFVYNSSLRFIVRMIPGILRQQIYSRLLRSK